MTSIAPSPFDPDVIVFFGPSGAGKTTMVRWMTDHVPGGCVYRPVAYTTRSPRTGEQNGVDYHFVTPKRFAELKAADAFLETGFFAGAWYGTHRATLLEKQCEQIDATDADRCSVAVLDLNQQGCEQLLAAQAQGKVNAYFVVLTAPRSVLETRMQQRGDAPDKITERMAALDSLADFAATVLPRALRLWNDNSDAIRHVVQGQLATLVYSVIGRPGNYPMEPRVPRDIPATVAPPTDASLRSTTNDAGKFYGSSRSLGRVTRDHRTTFCIFFEAYFAPDTDGIVRFREVELETIQRQLVMFHGVISDASYGDVSVDTLQRTTTTTKQLLLAMTINLVWIYQKLCGDLDRPIVPSLADVWTIVGVDIV